MGSSFNHARELKDILTGIGWVPMEGYSPLRYSRRSAYKLARESGFAYFVETLVGESFDLSSGLLAAMLDDADDHRHEYSPWSLIVFEEPSGTDQVDYRLFCFTSYVDAVYAKMLL